MRTFNTHYGLTTCEVVIGHQTRDSWRPVSCTCARWESHGILVGNADPGGHPQTEESGSPQTFISSHLFLSSRKGWSSSIVSLSLHRYSIHHQFMAIYPCKYFLHPPTFFCSHYYYPYGGSWTTARASWLADLFLDLFFFLLQPVADWLIILDTNMSKHSLSWLNILEALPQLLEQRLNYIVWSQIPSSVLPPAYPSSFLSLCSNHPGLSSLLQMSPSPFSFMPLAQAISSSLMFSTFRPPFTNLTSTHLLELNSDKIRSCHWHTPITLKVFLSKIYSYIFICVITWLIFVCKPPPTYTRLWVTWIQGLC